MQTAKPVVLALEMGVLLYLNYSPVVDGPVTAAITFVCMLLVTEVETGLSFVICPLLPSIIPFVGIE
jgi:hypothetical protein